MKSIMMWHKNSYPLKKNSNVLVSANLELMFVTFAEPKFMMLNKFNHHINAFDWFYGTNSHDAPVYRNFLHTIDSITFISIECGDKLPGDSLWCNAQYFWVILLKILLFKVGLMRNTLPIIKHRSKRDFDSMFQNSTIIWKKLKIFKYDKILLKLFIRNSFKKL